MPTQLTLLPDEPIITVLFSEPMNFKQEFPEAIDEILRLRDTLTGYSEFFVIADYRQITVEFKDIGVMMCESRRASHQRRDDLPVRILAVGKGVMVETAIGAMRYAPFGAYQIGLFTCMEDALESARSAL